MDPLTTAPVTHPPPNLALAAADEIVGWTLGMMGLSVILKVIVGG